MGGVISLAEEQVSQGRLGADGDKIRRGPEGQGE